MCVCVGISRTVFILSEALDEQLKTLWFSPFQTDDIESDLEMVSISLYIFKGQKIKCNPYFLSIQLISLNCVAVNIYDTDLLTTVFVMVINFTKPFPYMVSMAG